MMARCMVSELTAINRAHSARYACCVGVAYDEMDETHGRECFPSIRWVLSLRENRAHSARYICYGCYIRIY